MNITTFEQQYLGYINSHQLWNENSLRGLTQLNIEKINTSRLTSESKTRLRLGKRIEQFVSHELKQHNNIELLAENIQIRKDKITIGELDAIIKQNREVIHLEIAYKFYLFDSSVGQSEIESWIGPNRKDSLVEKLDKLKTKQLPLLYNPETQNTLSELKLNVKEISQRVFFKAQLFVPFHSTKQSYKDINNNCIEGVYISEKQLKEFSDCSFYIPEKIDWTITPHLNIEWFSYMDFTDQLAPLLQAKRSPLCWIKYPKGNLEKCFIIWW